VATGHLATKRFYEHVSQTTKPIDFTTAMTGVKLQHISNELLLKIYSRTTTDRDRNQLVREVFNHNKNLFLVGTDGRHHGFPGFYSLTE